MSEKFKALLAELDQANTDQQPLVKSIAAVVEPAPAAPAPVVAVVPAAALNPEDAADGGVLAKAIGETEALLAASSPAPAAADETVTIDGEEIFKSLEALGGRQSETEETLTKGITALLGLAKNQGTLIKSLSDRLDILGGTGTGRKTAIQVHERPALGGELAKAQPGMGATEILAKANSAWDAKKITGQEFTALDVSLRNGQVPDATVLGKILS